MSKKKVKVYQLIRRPFDKHGNLIPKEQRKEMVVCIGTVLIPKNAKHPEDSIWDLFNWTCWYWKDRRKAWIFGIRNGIRRDGFRCFPNTFAAGFCNSDIMIHMDDKWIAAKHFGWETFTFRCDAIELLRRNSRI